MFLNRSGEIGLTNLVSLTASITKIFFTREVPLAHQEKPTLIIYDNVR